MLQTDHTTYLHSGDEILTETVAYTVTGKVGEIEFRKYPELILATVNDPGEDSAFSYLFAYITGKNRAQGKIPMTAPVIISEQIRMTAPVISDEQSMSFVMPAGKSLAEMPEPLDEHVQLSTVPPREIAVIRFSGYARQKKVKEMKTRLLDGLKNAGIETRGAPFLMGYNPPWTPGFMRRNEVGVEITR
jgi:hypothetical protein